MRLDLLDILRCPFDNQDLSLIEFNSKRTQKELIEEGILYCSNCKRWFPIIKGIPKILPDDLREPKEVNLLYEHKDEIPQEVKKQGHPFNLDTDIVTTISPLQSSPAKEFIYKSRAMLERDRQANSYDEHFKSYQNEVEVPTTLRRLDLRKDDFLLDLGVGTGRFTEDYIGNCKEVVAIDFSFESLLVLKRKVEDRGLSNLHLLQCDLCFLPIKAELFDKVLTAEVFEHLLSSQSIEEGLAQIKRVLKNKGTLVISVYNYSFLKKLYKRMRRIGGVNKAGYHSEGKIYYYNFSHQEFKQLLSRYFKLMELCGILNGIPKISKRLSKRIRAQLDFFIEKTPFSFLFGHLLLAKCQKFM